MSCCVIFAKTMKFVSPTKKSNVDLAEIYLVKLPVRKLAGKLQPILRRTETNQTSRSVHLLSERLDYTQSTDSS
jgi:hypothetical protein